MRITRLFPAALVGCLLLTMLPLAPAYSTASGDPLTSRLTAAGSLGQLPAPAPPEAKPFLLAGDGELGATRLQGADDLVLYEIDNPESSPNYWVHWSVVTDTITYTLQEDTSPEWTDPVVRYSGEMTGTMIIGQDPGTWYYRVRATTPGGDTPWSNVVWTSVEPPPIYLPVVANRWPPVPYTPVLTPISNPDGDGYYQVSWTENPVRLADTYTLQEATNASFSANLRTVCTTAQQTCAVSGRPTGTYYYRVRGLNEWGVSAWSAAKSVTVAPPVSLINGGFEQGPDVGWEEYSTHGWAVILDSEYLPIDPRNGDWAAWLGGEDDDLSYVAQEVTVQGGSPYLIFWYWIASEDVCGYDYGGVVVNFSTVVDVFNLCQASNTGGWVRRAVNLAGYAGRTIVFDIRAETDGSDNSNLFVDDVSFAASALGAEAEPSGTARVPYVRKSQATILRGRLSAPDGERPRLLSVWSD